MAETAAASRARELGEMLRSRRDLLRPADVGLPEGTRRRTRGLRREEVAQLAAISPTYYAFLEQGRELHPSRQVLDALCTALRLAPVERAYVHDLVHGTVHAAAPAASGETTAPALAAIVDRLDPTPAYVTGRSWDVLAANRAVRLLWTDWPALPPADRNMLWWMFADPAAPSALPEWRQEAAALLGRFRAAASRHPADPAFTALRDRLLEHSEQVRAWWPRHQVAPLASGTKRLYHPDLGELVFDHVVLQLVDNPEHRLVMFNASDHVLDSIAHRLSQVPEDVRPRAF
jgi:transcriptional regulator with XRE-family HTH domain